MKHIVIALGVGFVFFFAHVGGARAQTCYTLPAEQGCGVYPTGSCTINASALSSTVAGGEDNTVGNASYSTIGGGGYNAVNASYATLAGGYENTIEAYADYSTICGGYTNSVVATSSNHSSYAFIGGGTSNKIIESGGNYCNAATIAGGHTNTITGSNYACISGGYGNQITDGSVYASIAGGESNSVESEYAFVGGGDANYIGTSAGDSAICGGASNIIDTDSTGGVIGGGYLHYIGGTYGTIVGGYENSIGEPLGTSYDYAFIGGGSANVVNGSYAVVGGGSANAAGVYGTEADYSSVLGGQSNSATGEWGTVGGGLDNLASGENSTVPGGSHCTADSSVSFAAGYYAHANAYGCFVWADDSQSNYQTCTVNTATAQTNAFVVRATGGVEFVTGTSSGTPNAGQYMNGGGSGWNMVSDYNMKRDVQEVDPREVLEHLLSIPVATWRYRAEATDALHMGPMAQDFYAAFKLGDDDRHINNLDSEGVALAAIKGVYGEVIRKDEAIRALNVRVETLEKINAGATNQLLVLEQANKEANQRVLSLEARLAQIEAQLGLRK